MNGNMTDTTNHILSELGTPSQRSSSLAWPVTFPQETNTLRFRAKEMIFFRENFPSSALLIASCVLYGRCIGDSSPFHRIHLLCHCVLFAICRFLSPMAYCNAHDALLSEVWPVAVVHEKSLNLNGSDRNATGKVTIRGG